MPRFFFDIDDGELQTIDEDGVELADEDAALNEAWAVLPSLARDLLPRRHERTLVATVRDESGRRLLQTRLSLVAHWL